MSPADTPELVRLPGFEGACGGTVDYKGWTLEAQRRRARGESLLALWGSDDRDRGDGFNVHAAYLAIDALTVLRLPVDGTASHIPSLVISYPAVDRMERALFDLLGLRAVGADTRPWLRHAAWRESEHPLRRDFVPADQAAGSGTDYRFVRVQGDGVHEIPVGPVHAGIIEPGHFRFSVVGEKVLRLEERLGYVHKGIEKRFEELSPVVACRLAARVSGDSGVAYSWSYCMALEGIAGLAPPPRGLHLRALALERERIANHLGDLGALGNDAGFAFGLSQFMRLKEQVLRLNERVAGQRYWLDVVEPGGVAFDLDGEAVQALRAELRLLEAESARLREIYADHAGVQDRFAACGVLSNELARQLGVVGLAARASGIRFDLRSDRPFPPYDALGVRCAQREEGDVAARVGVRFDELHESLRLCQALLDTLPAGPTRVAFPRTVPDGTGVGLVEGWRGPVFVALETRDGRIRRCHPHDPSWQNWPALEHAILGNIVPDFPLINKSFNLSYSGHDL